MRVAIYIMAGIIDTIMCPYAYNSIEVAVITVVKAIAAICINA